MRWVRRERMKVVARMMTMSAEHGTSMMAPMNRPAIELTREMIAEVIIMVLRLWLNVSAIIIGSDIIDIRSMMPTSRMVRTMHRAIMTVMISSMVLTGSPVTRAKSRSKAQVTIVRNLNTNSDIKAMV